MFVSIVSLKDTKLTFFRKIINHIEKVFCVACKAGNTFDIQGITFAQITYTKEHMPEHDTASLFYFIDKLPMRLVDKVDVRMLEKMIIE